MRTANSESRDNRDNRQIVGPLLSNIVLMRTLIVACMNSRCHINSDVRRPLSRSMRKKTPVLAVLLIWLSCLQSALSFSSTLAEGNLKVFDSVWVAVTRRHQNIPVNREGAFIQAAAN